MADQGFYIMVDDLGLDIMDQSDAELDEAPIMAQSGAEQYGHATNVNRREVFGDFHCSMCVKRFINLRYLGKHVYNRHPEATARFVQQRWRFVQHMRKVRAQSRCSCVKEELMARVWHPERITRLGWWESGMI